MSTFMKYVLVVVILIVFVVGGIRILPNLKLERSYPKKAKSVITYVVDESGEFHAEN